MNKPGAAQIPSDVRDVYSSNAARYDMLLKIYRVLGVNLKSWRNNAINRLPEIHKPRILDIGVGTGRNLPPLIHKYPEYEVIVGVDYTPAMLARAKRLVQENGWENIRLLHSDARELTKHLDETFDLIISTYSLSIIPNSPLVLREIKNLLSSDGYLMLLDCQKFTGLLSMFNPIAILLSTQLGGNEQTYSVRVSDIASSMFRPQNRRLLYSGMFYEDLYRKR
ncbi:MAG: class I SAM-dependent methyltransferase [Candidatus Thorarchaeota archaeon]